MDLGHRKSRQRRHLPTHATTLQRQGLSSTTTTTTSRHQQQNGDRDTGSDDDDNYHYQSSQQQRGRGRKHLAEKRMQQHFGNLVTLSKKGTMAGESTWRSGHHWRVWFWRFCLLWLMFLTMRVLTSIWQGDTTRLGLNQYLSQLPSTWWRWWR